MVLDLDLNQAPSVENVSLLSNPIGLSLNTDLGLGLPQIQATTDFEHVDDDVVICSPKSFAEAREKSRRNRGVIELRDEETESQRGHFGFWGITFGLFPSYIQPIPCSRRTGCVNLNVSLEGHGQTEWQSENVTIPQEVPPSDPKPKAPNFNCPVCISPFVEETSTKCGHIFCKECIKSAIAVQSKCPTCRQKIKMKDTFRIYLPTD